MDRRTFLSSLAATAIAPPLTAAAPHPLGLVSVTYDDGLDSQLDVAAPQLRDLDMHATFYLTWDNMKDRAAEWAALANAGHELANHSMTHPCDLQRENPATFEAREIDPLQHWLSTIEGPQGGRDFAYPCDVTNLGGGTANQQAHRFARLLRRAGINSARTSEGPPNSRHWTRVAPYRLQALALAYDTKGPEDVHAYLLKARQQGAWAILVVHDVGAGKRSDGVISAEEHLTVLQMIKNLQMSCGTVEAMLKRQRQSSARG